MKTAANYRYHANLELRIAKLHIKEADRNDPDAFDTAVRCAWKALCQALYWRRRAAETGDRWLRQHGAVAP